MDSPSVDNPSLTPEQEVGRGIRARQILNDPLVSEALTDLERAVIDNIAACPPVNTELQQKLCMLLGVTRKFKQVLQSHIETGKLAEFSEFQLRKRKAAK